MTPIGWPSCARGRSLTRTSCGWRSPIRRRWWRRSGWRPAGACWRRAWQRGLESRIQADGRIKRAMVVDCDVHHGNGTAVVFADDPTVFTLSIHQFNNYPSEKPLSSLDIHLADGTGDAEYLNRLGNGYRAALAIFHPELVLYVAGAD